MENRYLCRGRRIDNKDLEGDWITGYYCYNGWTGNEKHYIIPDFASVLYGFEVDPVTVGQYTGLKDKNGNLIFEGDILQFDDFSDEVYERKGGYDFINVATVCWMNGRFLLENFREDTSLVLDGMEEANHDEFIFTFSSSEVIGNIHDKK